MGPNKYTRFLSKVDHHNFDPERCWEWRGADKQNGYGHWNNGERSVPAHRAAYEMFVGETRPGLDVYHSCDNRACVNPDHLFLGTRKDNMQDAKRKGRISRGEKHAMALRTGRYRRHAKLTDTRVRAIVARVKSGHVKSQIARDYGVTPGTVNAIMRGDAWADITGIRKSYDEQS